MRKKNFNFYRQISFAVLICFSAFCFEGCRQDKLPADVNGGHISKTSEEKNEEFAIEEQNEAVEQKDLNDIDAPDEGYSQTPYENLEQPDELVNVPEILIFKSQFIISYNVEKKCPNYVCWQLTPGRTKGNIQRPDKFFPDLALSEGARVDFFDYNNSGYDRGHMCPAADNKNSQQAMEESFLLTNICPQNHALNEGAWNDLEMKCRSWVNKYKTLYICCGPIFDSKTPQTIGKRKGKKIAVPDRFFKVILTLGDQPKSIGFIYPNKPSDQSMSTYSVSVDEVEKITGMNFFYQLDDKTENQIEKVCNPSDWGL